MSQSKRVLKCACGNEFGIISVDDLTLETDHAIFTFPEPPRFTCDCGRDTEWPDDGSQDAALTTDGRC